MVTFSKRNVMFTSVCTTCNKTGYGNFYFNMIWMSVVLLPQLWGCTNICKRHAVRPFWNNKMNVVNLPCEGSLQRWMWLVCFFPLGNWPCGLIGSASVWVIVHSNWDSCWLLVWSDCRVKTYWPSLSNQSFMSVNAINSLAYFMWIGLERHSISMC